uniref:Uncharacterized protein n=1 Tax=Arundo donax TaxID=35708 RepID=A0A0A8YA43_ARUDO
MIRKLLTYERCGRASLGRGVTK